MDTFFPTTELAPCFERLTDYGKVIKGAYRLGGFLLRETVCRGSQVAVLTVKAIREGSGLTSDTINEHLRILAQLGAFPFRELGSGAHKEYVIALGTPASKELLAQYDAGQMSIAELLERGQLTSKKLPLAPKNSEVTPKNSEQEEKILDLPPENSGLPPKNLELPPKKSEIDPYIDPLDPKDPDPDLDPGSDFNNPDPDPDQESKGKAEAARVSQALVMPSKPEELLAALTGPQQLSFRANLMAAIEPLVQLSQWLRTAPTTEPGPAEQPAAPADILPFQPPAPPAPPAPPKSEPAPTPPLPAKQSQQATPPKADFANFKVEMAARLDRLAAMKPTAHMAEIGQAVKQLDEKMQAERAAQARKIKPEELSNEEAQLRITEILEHGIERTLRDLHKEFIKVPEGRDPKWEYVRIGEFAEDLERADQRLLLYLEKAFEQAKVGNGRSVSSARINLARIGRELGLQFADRRPEKKGA